MRRSAALALATGGTLAVGALAWRRLRGGVPGTPKPVTGMFPNGMAYLRWGTGPKTLLWIVGGPGIGFPIGLRVASIPFVLRPFAQNGYTCWLVNRKRDMPKGYTIADMAEDHASLIADEFGGKVELVLGEDYGGMVGYYLAARHPDRLDYLANASTGYALSDRGKTIDHDLSTLIAQGRSTEGFARTVEMLAPDLKVPGVARALGAVMARLFVDRSRPDFVSNLMVETEAEFAYDAREVLPDISVPVLLVGGDRGPFFSREILEETARLIPDCTLRIYEGRTDPGAVSDKRVARDVLDFVRQRSEAQPGRDAEQPSVIDQATAATHHIREEGRVEAPVEHVWAFLCDTSRWHDWDPRSEYLDFSGPVDQVGTTFVETSRLMAWDMKAHHTVVEVEPQRLLHHRSDKGFDIFFRLEPDGDATHLIVDCDYRLPGHLPGFVKDLLSRSFVERTMRETGEKFRALAEATVPAPA